VTIFNPGNIKFGLKDPKVGLGMGYLPWLDATSQNFQSFYHGTNVGADSPNVAMYVIKNLKIRYVQGKARGGAGLLFLEQLPHLDFTHSKARGS